MVDGSGTIDEVTEKLLDVVGAVMKADKPDAVGKLWLWLELQLHATLTMANQKTVLVQPDPTKNTAVNSRFTNIKT